MLKKHVRSSKQRALLRYKRKAPVGIPRTISATKAAADAHERAIKWKVREKVQHRDGWCRVARSRQVNEQDKRNWDPYIFPPQFPCLGPSEWAHLLRRSKTRGMAPEDRHTSKGSIKACRKHHTEIDQHRLSVTPLTDRGADGPLKFERIP
jgi:hypothetical protein